MMRRLAWLLLLPALIMAKAPPHIVTILVDDVGWGDLGCFGGMAHTPHLDRLAAEGKRFEHFYVMSPICSPPRAGLLTGQYPSRWRVTSFLAKLDENAARGIADNLDPTAPTFARALRGNGYATGHFGKWHLGGQRDVSAAPLITAYGFDETLTNFEGLGPRLLGLNHAPDKPVRPWSLLSEKNSPGPIIWMDRSQITSGYARAALNFLQRAAAAGRPAYVNVWTDDPHSPFFPPLDRWGDGKRPTLYRAVIEAMDVQLGEFLDGIRQDPTLRDNTLVVFLSDNGPEPGSGSAGPFRGTKGTLFEGGLRSPLIVWGPGVLDRTVAGTVDRESVFSSIDLNATLRAVGGAPAAPGKIDGEVLRDTLLGRAVDSRSGPLFFRRPPDRKNFGNQTNLPDLAVRDGRWKLLCDYDGSAALLYDVVADPGETRDLATEEPAATARLRQAVVAWQRQHPADLGATYRSTSQR